MSRVRRLGRWTNLLLAGVLMFAVWVLLVLVASRSSLKKLWDFSPQAVFTMSPATEELLAELRKQRVKVEFHTFFRPLPLAVSDDPFERQKVQILSRLQKLTEDVLREYAFLGGESVRVKHHDIQRPNDETREAAKKYGSAADLTDKVVVVAGGRHKRLSLEGDLGVIDNPEWRPSKPGMPNTALPTLKDYKGEEALSSALKSLLAQGKPVLYFLKGDREHDLDSDLAVGDGYGAFHKALEAEGCEVHDLELARGEAMPKDASLIVALEPRGEFTQREAELLFGYLRRGGRLFLNYSYVDVDGWNPNGGDLGRLLGFEVGNRPVFHLVPTEDGSGRGDTPEVANLLTIRDWAVQNDKGPGVLHGLSHVHPITRPLVIAGRTPQLMQGRELTLITQPPQNVHHEELLRTGPMAWLGTPEQDPRALYHPPSSPAEYRSRLLGAVIDVDGEADGKKVTGQAVILTAAAFINLRYSYNGDLGGNIVNWLTERKELVTVRGSRYEARNLKVSEEQLGRIRLLLVWGVPLLFAAVGLAVRFRRSRVR